VSPDRIRLTCRAHCRRNSPAGTWFSSTAHVSCMKEFRKVAEAARTVSGPLPDANPCRSGGTGRRAGLKIPCPQGREGSTPSSGTRAIRGLAASPALFACPGAHGRGRTGFGRRRTGGKARPSGARQPEAAPQRPMSRTTRLRRATPSSGTKFPRSFVAEICPPHCSRRFGFALQRRSEGGRPNRPVPEAVRSPLRTPPPAPRRQAEARP
jgi:hypothetical protein